MLKALPDLVEELVPFGLMMFVAVEMNPDYYLVQLDQLEVTTVSIVTTLESYALQVSVAV